jgi:hypothetical protein
MRNEPIEKLKCVSTHTSNKRHEQIMTPISPEEQMKLEAPVNRNALRL